MTNEKDPIRIAKKTLTTSPAVAEHGATLLNILQHSQGKKANRG